MKQVLFLKYTDIAGQALMLLPLIFLASPDRREFAFYTYFTVGGWQAVSCGLHAIFGNKPNPDRRRYAKMLAWILGLFALCAIIFFYLRGYYNLDYSGNQRAIDWKPAGEFVAGIAFVEAAVMLFGGPFMAIWYAMVTVDEIHELKAAIHHRSEVHWKL